MDDVRISRFKDRARVARRRLVAVGVIAAFAAASVVGSAASAAPAPGTTTCNGQQLSAPEALLACLLALANSSDFQPKDMKVAAPSSVISSAMTSTPNTSAPESPTKRVAEVNRWRPNPQAWIDAKTRVSGATGLTSRDVAQTARWQPKLTPGTVPVGKMGTSLLRGGAGMLAFAAVDGLIVPGLESGLGLDGVVNSYWCSQRAAGKIDLTSYLVVDDADCVGWQAAQDAALELGLSSESLNGKQLCIAPGNCLTVMLTSSSWQIAQKRGYFVDADWRRTGVVCFDRGDGMFPNRVQMLLQAANGQSVWVNGGSAGLIDGDKCKIVGGMGTWALARAAAGYEYVTVQAIRYSSNPGSQIDAEQGAAEWITQVKCLDGSIRYAVSEAFDFEAGGMMPEPAAVDLAGCTPVETSVGVQDAGTGVTGWQDSRKVAGEMVPTAVQDWMRDFPNCWDGSCLLELKKTVGAGELDCFEAPEQCVNWYEESVTAPDRYKCYYGGQLRALNECLVYTRVFDREKVQQGTGYADPATGEAPKDQTGATQTTNPGAAVTAMKDPVKDPSTARQCWPEGWAAFNPFEWVFQPVKCALEWAFVPRQSKLDQTQTAIRLAALNSRPGQLVSSIASWGTAVEAIDPSGCAGPPVTLDLMGITYSGYPLSACAEPTATLAWWSRLIIGVSVVLSAGLAISRYLGVQFGLTGLGRSPGGDT